MTFHPIFGNLREKCALVWYTIILLPRPAVRHLRALDSARVPRARAPSLPASGTVSSRKWPYLSLDDLTPRFTQCIYCYSHVLKVLWKYTYLNERILIDNRLCLAFKRCGFEFGTLSYLFICSFVRLFSIISCKNGYFNMNLAYNFA